MVYICVCVCINIYIYIYIYIYIHIYIYLKDQIYICNRVLLSIIKKNEILPFVATWMDLDNIILCEVSQTKTNI